jgi:hypothetical protein
MAHAMFQLENWLAAKLAFVNLISNHTATFSPHLNHVNNKLVHVVQVGLLSN